MKTKVFEYVKEKYGEQDAKQYYSYLEKLLTDSKQSWAKNKDANFFILKYEEVKREGMTIDGKHITLGFNGISYDYVAYKNKMLIHYPESIIDIQLVFKGDEFNVEKKDGKVLYSHKIANPFENGNDKIIGGYCVIKNARGEFITNLSAKDFQDHRAVAKTKFIWDKWYKEMCMKTLFKKAIKVHYDDEFERIEEEDNKNYDLNKTEEVDLSDFKKIKE